MRYVSDEKIRNSKTGVVISIDRVINPIDMKNYRVAHAGSEYFFASNWGAFQKAQQLAGKAEKPLRNSCRII
jgi:hypothetical protein